MSVFKFALFISFIFLSQNNPTKCCFSSVFDYIIVGGGSAGSTLANRLSDDSAISILLIEAGGDPDPSTEVPYVALQSWKTHMDWNYVTVPQKKACLGLDGKRSHWSMGKCLGGSSILNFMLYVRGNRRDYDTWALPGWSYKNLLSYFVKSEDMRNRDMANSSYHGTGGPLAVTTANYRSPLSYAFEESLNLMGYNSTDYNGDRQTGVAPPQFTIIDATRCSTEKAFLRPALKRKNLHVLKNTRVIKINLDNSKRAEGVDFKLKKDGRVYTAYVRKEVLLCAGAVHSPQLLMMSGIGPREHLNSMGITVLVDLPGVGQNLMDHVGAGGIILKLNSSVSLSPNTVLSLDHVMEYQLRKSGPLAVGGGIEGLAFVNSKYANQSEDFPDIEIIAASSFFNFYGTNQKIVDALPFSELRNAAYLVPTLLHPKSRGEVKLASKDPYEPPIIDPKYLTSDEDVLRLIEGLKITKKIVESNPYKKYGAEIFPPDRSIPGCENMARWSEMYYECLVRTLTYTIFHYSGTCKMGSSNTDAMAVVDSDLKVRGILGLRVVDASIFPIIPSGNTNAATVMVAEKAADLIKNGNA